VQIIIPMSGFGERFLQAGYTVPKPLIEIDGKPIIGHVIDMFPGEQNFIFICNEEHLANQDWHMESILRQYCPTGQIIGISSHKLGPIHAVQQVDYLIDAESPVVVNYCDFTCYWNWYHFKDFVHKTACIGAIPAYKGFHPHTLWSNYYAYVKEQDCRVNDIQEKQPFTDNPRQEFASSGTYYFKTGALMLEYFQRCIDEKLLVSNEYYVSMAFKPMIQDDLAIYTYELQHFMQWGTPSDLNEYKYWSNIFREIIKEKDSPYHKGSLLLPMAGLGSRFQKEGYETPKPLILVSGLPMAVQAMNDMPNTDMQRCILRDDMNGLTELISELNQASNNASFETIDTVTDGQATTCVLGSNNLALDEPVTIAACDNGMLYDSDKFNDLMVDDNVDVIVWGARGYPGAIRSPEMYGWIDTDDNSSKVNCISVKEPLNNPDNDPIVIGAFTFKKLSYFLDAVKRMKSRQAKVNGEYYVDMVINDSISMGKNNVMFEVDRYICWGTPNDLKTFEYWQSCFHKWNSHTYKLDLDPNISKKSIMRLKDKYTKHIYD
jgi:NDP-sugar pyrophosphorylase family protein